MFSLSAKQASQRVEIWRRLRRYGALALKNSGYILPNSANNEERFQWLAREVRRNKGQATIVQAQAFDGLPATELTRRFADERSKEYAALLKELQRGGKKIRLSRSKVGRLRKRFEEIVHRDFFGSPLRSKVEALLVRADEGEQPPEPRPVKRRTQFVGRTWVTRPRPGIDRAASAWLIRRFIDPDAVFVFAENPNEYRDAVPFDMFSQEGFSHRGEDCTMETLIKEFGLDDTKVHAISQGVHDADLGDEKFDRKEALGLDRVLTGWAQQGIADDELLRRGIEMFEGLYQVL